MSMQTLEIIDVDYHNPSHAQQLIELLDSYARDPMGGGAGLKPDVKATLVARLAQQAQAFSLFAYVDGEAVALANCLESFSTFAARPIINIHDFMVIERMRGQGISQALLQRISEIAQARGCCKVSLEVLSGNVAARKAYQRFGFQPYQLDPASGYAEFWQLTLE